MSPNRRIALNIAATYGRSLVGLCCGLFTARWVLMVLGVSDYGVWSVVGGLAFFVSFLNALFAGATSRFFAYSVKGADLRDWFRTAVIVHVVLACGLLVIGYPVGAWVVRHGLDIPVERVGDAVVAFRYVALACWEGMIAVPFTAMYTAHQNIAEVTVYGLAQSLAHLALLGYAVTHPGDWFIGYVIGVTAINVVPQLCIMVGAVRRYPACRGLGRVADFARRFREMGSFAFWQLFGGLGSLARAQGLNVLLNRLGGTSANASFGIASQVNGQVQSLSAALQGAFSPVITSGFGSGDLAGARRFAFRACRFSLLLMLVFTIPLLLELDEVLRLWLVTPPEGASVLCGAVLCAAVIDKATSGHATALNANGVIGAYQVAVGTTLVLTLPVGWVLYRSGLGLGGIGISLVGVSLLAGLARVVFARRLVRMGAKEWLKDTISPIFGLTVVTGLVGYLPHLWMAEGFARVCVTTAFSLAAFVPISWWAVLTKGERERIVGSRKYVVGSRKDEVGNAEVYAARSKYRHGAELA